MSFASPFLFLLGLVVGSFLNVVIMRLPAGMSIRGRSRCVSCARQLTWTELVPVLSFFFLRGKCRSCRTPLSWQYPIVELTTGALFLFVWFFHSGHLSFVIFHLFSVSILLVIFMQDFRFGVILDHITIPSIFVAFLANLFFDFSFATAQSLVLGMVIGGGIFFLQYIFSGGRWIGGGDIRLGVLMGAMLGWTSTLLALMLAYVGGAFVALLLLAFRMKRFGETLPFGTFLAIATVVSLFWGEEIIEWYVHLLY